MKSEEPVAGVIIVGGGYSGTMLAAELARRGINSVLVEGGERAGRGTAFSTSEEVHLLNVVASRMGAWPDQPDHFFKAVESEGHAADDFVPRRRYGEYLRSILDEAIAGGLVQVIGREAAAVTQDDGGWRITLADGTHVEGQALVLAQGNQPPEPHALAQGISPKLFANDPWSDEGRAAIALAGESDGDVLTIGTGLTMVDVVLSLNAAGHRGRIVALSRRGLTPRAHAPHDVQPVEQHEVPHGSVIALWRWLRGRAGDVGWRTAVDSLRPHSQALWQALGEGEQRRFLRHARPWWDVHRHRIAPEVAEQIRHLVQHGWLTLVAGQVTQMREEKGQLLVGINRRGAAGPTFDRFALVVNCTGPLSSISKSKDGVLNDLFEAELARVDTLDLGLEVDSQSRIEGARRAWALGPLTKGRFWEITAVPDIRGQVAAVAGDIAMELEHALQS